MEWLRQRGSRRVEDPFFPRSDRLIFTLKRVGLFSCEGKE